MIRMCAKKCQMSFWSFLRHSGPILDFFLAVLSCFKAGFDILGMVCIYYAKYHLSHYWGILCFFGSVLAVLISFKARFDRLGWYISIMIHNLICQN